MAKYDRDFLVPYLEDVCALYIVKRNLTEQIMQAQVDEFVLLTKSSPKKPPMEEENYSLVAHAAHGFGKVLMCLICAAWVSAIFGGVGNEAGVMLIFTYIIGLVYFISRAYLKKEKKENQEIKARNKEREMKWWDESKVARISHEIPLKEAKEKTESLEKERAEVENLLETVYSVNIIPSRYRNQYVAIYLYDWFTSSRADDLEAALNMFVLEDIKSKLDTIIENQQSMILNQRIMIAKQQDAIDQAERHHTQLMEKLNRIELSNEERNMYLRMIDANVRTTTFFATVDYLES